MESLVGRRFSAKDEAFYRRLILPEKIARSALRFNQSDRIAGSEARTSSVLSIIGRLKQSKHHGGRCRRP